MQPVNAGPAEPGEQLPVVAELASGAHLGRVRKGQVRVTAETATIDLRGNTDHMGRLHITPGASHQPQHLGLARHHHCARGGGSQYQLFAALGVVMGKLLGQGAAPGHANDIDLAIVEVVEHACGEFGQARETIGVAWGR
ncbi:hypothetical protein D3C80_1636850 [compost metagenome]